MVIYVNLDIYRPPAHDAFWPSITIDMSHVLEKGAKCINDGEILIDLSHKIGS